MREVGDWEGWRRMGGWLRGWMWGGAQWAGTWGDRGQGNPRKRGDTMGLGRGVGPTGLLAGPGAERDTADAGLSCPPSFPRNGNGAFFLVSVDFFFLFVYTHNAIDLVSLVLSLG